MAVPLNAENIANGASLELLEKEIQKVVENIMDINTEPKKARSVTLKMVFKPNENRNFAEVSIQATSKLEPIMAVTSEIYIDQDIKSGKVQASEKRADEDVNQHSFEGTHPGKIADFNNNRKHQLN